MIRRGTAAALLGISIIGGMAAGVAADAMTSDTPTRQAKPRGSVTAPAPQVKPGVEVKKPILVMNDDGTATLSATLVNHTEKVLEINSAANGQAEDRDAPPMLLYGDRDHIPIEPDVPLRIGGVGDGYRLRLRDRVQVGSTLPITIGLVKHDGYDEDHPEVTFLAPVVARASAYGGVANNGPNSEISVHDGVIVVVPGQAKAYIDGWFESTIDDMTEVRPTVAPRRGESIEILHQTATGGPSGFSAQAGQRSLLGYPPYLDREPHGDADYVRAGEVKVGETYRVTFRFPSGDVVAKFKVVQGKPDGTI